MVTLSLDHQEKLGEGYMYYFCSFFVLKNFQDQKLKNDGKKEENHSAKCQMGLQYKSC